MAISRPPSSSIDPELALSFKFSDTVFSYNERDVALYALGVGACGGDALDEKELKYVYHQDGQPFIQVISWTFPHERGYDFVKNVKQQVLPTFTATFMYQNKQSLGIVPGLHFDPTLLLHGQQYLEIYKPLPSNCCIQNKVVIAGLHDKGKAAIIELQTTSYDKNSGEALCMSRSTIYLRGAGGFSKSSKPYSYVNYPANQISPVKIPNSKPSFVYEDITQQSQALIYRLSGDYNPLHSDPMVGKNAGFSRPILHGLCSFGFAVRAVVKSCCNGEPTWVKSIFGRFLLHVYPGETLITEMWLEGTKVTYQTKVKERNRPVLSGYVILKHIPSSL